MVAVIQGLWYNYAERRVYDATITLSLQYSGYLISGLTLAVTLAGSSFWTILAFFLHSWRARHPGNQTTVLGLQYQASLQNTASATSALSDAGKTAVAWRGRGISWLFLRMLGFALPALVAWGGFIAAGVFVSSVANKAYGSTVARVQTDNCGFITADTTNFLAVAALGTKVLNDTIQGRNYMTNFYQNVTASLATISQPLFVQAALPVTTNTAAACPIPAADLCIPGHNGAFSLTTPPLDSQLMLGVNAKAEDRVTVTLSTTCSPLDHTGFVEVVNDGGLTAALYYLGPLANISDFTYGYIDQTVNTSVAYMLDAVYAYAKNPAESAWAPIADLARDDADLSLMFFSQNAVSYYEPVYDPFFLANGTITDSFGSQTFYDPNNYVNTMICADQYTLCNPNSNTCTPAGGLQGLRENVVADNTPGFNATQYATAVRIINAIANAGTYKSVNGLGAAALFATNLLSQRISPAVPDTQWQTEVAGWFGTSLAKIQASMVAFADNGFNLGPYVYVTSPYSGVSPSVTDVTAFDIAVNQAWQDQCRGQLVQVTGAVQNFSFLGVMIIAGVSVFLVMTSLVLGPIVDAIAKNGGPVAIARQADDKFHLQRMALGDPADPDNTWQRGTFNVPVLQQGTQSFRRPAAPVNAAEGGDRLTSYIRPLRLVPVRGGAVGGSPVSVAGVITNDGANKYADETYGGP